MDYLLAILHLPSNLVSSEKRLLEFSNVTILLTSEKHMSIDVVRHTIRESDAALTYGSICLSPVQLFEFITQIDRARLRTCFTIFVQEVEFDPSKWNLESIFPEIHYNHQRSNITREKILDADQGCMLYPFLNTKIGKSLHHFYLEIYHKYYNDHPLSAHWVELEGETLLPSVPPMDGSDEETTFNTEGNKLKVKERMKESQNLSLLPSYSKHVVSSVSIDVIDEYPSKLPPVYKPILYEEQRSGEGNGILKSLFSCITRTEPKFRSQVELEHYDNILYHGIRHQVHGNRRMTAIEVLSRGAIVKNNVGRKRFYEVEDVKECVSPMELCEYVSREWNVEIELLLPLIHYAIKSADMVVAEIISDIIKNLLKIKRSRMKHLRSIYLVIGKRCRTCMYDQVSHQGKPHYHVEFLDKLFHQDLNAFKRYTILAFEISKISLNIQRDGDYLELELF